MRGDGQLRVIPSIMAKRRAMVQHIRIGSATRAILLPVVAGVSASYDDDFPKSPGLQLL